MIKPFKHQLKSLKHADTTPYVFDCSDPGTGKTGVAIWATERRIKRKQVRRVLILAPKSLLRSVWYNDFRKFAPAIRVAVSTAGKHEAVFAQNATVYVTNIDAVNWLAKQPKKFFTDFDELIIDESNAYKHHTSKRSKAVAKIAEHFKYRRALTGTPNSNSITDVWHQIKILDGGKRLGGSFFAFRSAVCTPVQVGRNVNALHWTDKPGAEAMVFGMLSDMVIRHKFEDCVDIPPNHKYTVPYQMTAKQRRTYDEMENVAICNVYGSRKAFDDAVAKGVRPTPVDSVTAVNAAAVMTKLQQIASGAVYASPDKYHVIDTARYELALDLIEERAHSLTFFLWKHQRDLLLAEAEKRGITYALIDGSVNERERDTIVKNYQEGAYQTLFAHPKSAAHGLTLTKGTATIWVSPTYDLDIFVQGSKRQHRMGQTQKTETIVITAEDSVEQKIWDALLAKEERMDTLLDLFATL